MPIELNTITCIDALAGLKLLPDNYVNCIVTSPPYWNLRDYGVDGQLGLESTPEDFVEVMTILFRECKRVLREDGTLWLNIGDTYAHSTINKGSFRRDKAFVGSNKSNHGHGLKTKDLIGIPWMLAFALRADGWYLRQDIIWHKPNPMPESITDRCTKSHEYIFLLSKSNRYHFDHFAIQDDVPFRTSGNKERKPGSARGCPDNNGVSNLCGSVPWEGLKSNKRSVWSIPTAPLKDAHFATFPEEIPALCIKAGAPAYGIVLDPFMGAGTTALVARKLQRDFIGFELNPAYIAIAKRRLDNELGMFSPGKEVAHG